MDADDLDREYAAKYQPLILLAEAAEIARRPLGTIYDWSSQGLFDGFKVKQGRVALLGRKAFLRFLMGGDET